MESKDQFFFEDFTEDNYRRLLRIAKTKSSIVSFETMFNELDSKVKQTVWRHDIDFSVHRSLKLAQIESEEGIHAVYYVHMNCIFYNIFEKEINQKILEIQSLGHEIGVHFDCEFYNELAEKQFIDELTFVKETMEHLYSNTITSFSFHNPTPAMLEQFQEKQYAGLYNAYAKVIRDQAGYCSDSNGYWRFRRLEDFLQQDNSNKKVVLTHPAWWTPDVMAPRERIQRVIDGRKRAVENQYDQALVLNGRKNVK